MARKPREMQMEEHIVTDADTPGLPAMADAANQLAAMHAAYDDDRDLINRLMGRLELAGGIQKLLTVVSLKDLAHIKENKLYRVFAGRKGVDADGNEIADVGTFEGFCLSIGTTRQKADEDLANLKMFGEEALKSLNHIGAGYRDLRKLRKLPEDERSLVIQEVEVAAGDKDAILSLIDDLAAKHAKEKAELRAARETAEKDLESARDLSASKQERINALQDEIDGLHGRRKRMTPDEKLKEAQATAHSRALEVEVCVLSLGAALRELRAIAEETGRDQTAVMAGLVGQGMAHLMDLRDLLQLPEVSAGPAAPWMTGSSPRPEGEGA